MGAPDDIEEFLEDLRSSMDRARQEEVEARATGDRDAELRARMRYHRLRESYQDEVRLSSNWMLREYVESELLRRYRRAQRRARREALRPDGD